MDTRSVLIVGIPLVLGAAVLLVVAITMGRSHSTTGALEWEARRADRSAPDELAARPDLDEEARARYSATKAALEPAGKATPQTVGRGLVTFGPRADPEALGVSRRQFFN